MFRCIVSQLLERYLQPVASCRACVPMADPASATVALAEPSRTSTHRPGTPKPKRPPKAPPGTPPIAPVEWLTPAVAPVEAVADIPSVAQVDPASDDHTGDRAVSSFDDACNDASQTAGTSFVTALDAQPVVPAARASDGYIACFSCAVTCRLPSSISWAYEFFTVCH